MRNLLCLIVLFLLILPGCDSDSNPVEDIDEGSLSISGKIYDFNGHFNKIYARSFPKYDSTNNISSSIKNDGSFKISLPKPDESSLSGYTPFNYTLVINDDTTTLIDSINIIDSQLKYVRYDLFVKSSSEIVYALPINPAKITNRGGGAEVGDYFISYYYFSAQTKIQGYYKWSIVIPDSAYEIITEFDINTKIGWNMIMTKFDSINPNKTIYTVTDIETEQGDWIIGASDSFSNALRRF